ncbi:major facilitator superfamily permease [Liquorilactobacillus aquaticus DSM 21051]|uniref:Major facilitator superfamily permease n=1 Tax=Liquorilactobacillus aquaticus DSM 21051 TaxID=1423725 RepID=A0A0R2D8X0_9LACO|nr:major facilitator superfamily permease [Liquorilactobacillus aquaticus DSM 21051]
MLSKGRYDEAEKIIAALELNGSYSDTPTEGTKQQAERPNLKRGLFIAIIAVSAVMVSQYTFTSWAPTLLIEKNINIVHSLGYFMIMMTGAPIGALIGAILVDWIGRKKTIIPTFIFSAILGLLYTQQTNPAAIIIIDFFLTMTFYILMASVVGVYVSELFVTNFRFRGAGTANGAAKILTVLTPYFATWAIQKVSVDLIFYLIAALMLIAAIVVSFFGPETKQQEIQ